MLAHERTLATARFLAEDPVHHAPTGATPHEVIFRQNKAQLRYFRPAEVRRAPVFVCMPLINTWTIWDLLPDRSVLRALTDAGAPVYLLDWGRPGPEDATCSLADAVDGLLPRCFDRLRRHARAQGNAEDCDAIGYCVGGTLLAMHLARHASARRAAFVATPIDFDAGGRLATWADPHHFPLDAACDAGNIPAEQLRSAFQWLKPMAQSRKWVALWERIDDPHYPALWAALERWSDDSVPFPAEMYREYVRACYFENRLMRGGWRCGGRPVDLGAARIPAVAIAASDDHIVPVSAAHALARVWGGATRTVTLRGGHVGICVGQALPDALVAWLAEVP